MARFSMVIIILSLIIAASAPRLQGRELYMMESARLGLDNTLPLINPSMILSVLPKGDVPASGPSKKESGPLLVFLSKREVGSALTVHGRATMPGENPTHVVKPEPETLDGFPDGNQGRAMRPVVLADLNVDPPPPTADDSPLVTRSSVNDESSQEKSGAVLSREVDGVVVEGDSKKPKGSAARSRPKVGKLEPGLDCGGDADIDQPGQGTTASRDEKGLVHAARKMPKNAHVHFVLGVMYQRLGQPQKAVLAYEKALEILLRPEAEIDRSELISLVQIHQAQCILLESFAENKSNKEIETVELNEIMSKLKDSMHRDPRHAGVWNSLGLLLLKTGRLQSAISVLSFVSSMVPDNCDCLANLGIAHLQSGNIEESTKCFQELILKDQNHPAALVNYAALLLCKYGSSIPGPGAQAAETACHDKISAINMAKECLLTALKSDPKAPHIWTNLADAYFMLGDHRNSSRCLEKAAKLDPGCMATRYAVALHRVKDAERSQDPSEQLSWAGNEMASILREGDPAIVQGPVAWAGLAMVHKVQHEIIAAYGKEGVDLMDAEKCATHSLTQAISEEPEDALHWHQLGIHNLCTQQYKASQKYLKAAVARLRDCCAPWSNLGISLELSSEPSQAEAVYKQALSLAGPDHAHAIFSNLGILYRQQGQYDRAKAMLSKSLEIQPGYAPAFNNLGLVFVAEGHWGEARYCFERALESDPLLDAAKSNLVKAEAILKLCRTMDSCTVND
ncbi:hypothetical protein MLD38_016713 [Melastoma candidum]|uniref:Uncharacterized protein n=1 Tax=Melastoma candidum TaxID=119954 RepID=A0ACB9QSB6_9MYRT|nr:hypothetical protein MLD38_016713 [Melastoma candidum]